MLLWMRQWGSEQATADWIRGFALRHRLLHNPRKTRGSSKLSSVTLRTILTVRCRSLCVLLWHYGLVNSGEAGKLKQWFQHRMPDRCEVALKWRFKFVARLEHFEKSFHIPQLVLWTDAVESLRPARSGAKSRIEVEHQVTGASIPKHLSLLTVMQKVCTAICRQYQAIWSKPFSIIYWPYWQKLGYYCHSPLST